MELNILFEDNHLLVAYKPQDVEFLEFTELVRGQIAAQKETQNVYIQPLYALDKCMGGVAVFCLTSKAYDRCLIKFLAQECEFGFYAVCLANERIGTGGYSEYAEYVTDTTMRRVPELNKNANNISFNYRKIESIKEISLYKVTASIIIRNAIRFGLADLGVPVFGDKDYGGDKLAKDTHVAMCLVDFAIEHPVTKDKLRFRCLPPITNKPWSYFDIERILKVAR